MPPDFTLSPSPASRTVVQGQSATYTITVSPVNGFASSVTLSVTSGLPAGASATFVPSSLTPPGSATLTISTSGATPAATSTITVHGDGSGPMHDTTVSLTVVAAGGGGQPLALTPSSATVTDGSQLVFSATGGTGPYTFSFVTNQSGATLNGSTGLYTAGGTAGTDRVRVTDAVSATVEADIAVTVVGGDVAVSLDGRALRALGSAQTFNIFATSGALSLTGLSTDRVHELNLLPGAYTLTAGATSFSFTVTAACALTLP